MLRDQIDKESVRFSEAEREYLDLANPGEIAELANHLDYYFTVFIQVGETLMDQADLQQSLLSSLEQDFEAITNLTSLNLSEQIALTIPTAQTN